MVHIVSAEVFLVNLTPKVVRHDAIQSFVEQETPIVRLLCDDGSEGIGYTYTIGTGGTSVVSLLTDHLLPQLIGVSPANIEQIWRQLYFSTHATAVGAITSLALAAIDTALWDWRAKRSNNPLWIEAGGAQEKIPVYTTEGGWLQLPVDILVKEALVAKNQGFKGAKMKVGKSHVSEDIARISAVREAVGPAFELMVDANQAFTVSEAMRRASQFEAFDLAWFEEPLPSDDMDGHMRLSAHTSVPIAVGESLYSIAHFREYLQHGACSIVQVDVARIGGITPWLKVAHLAESFNVAVCPHFLMELHVSMSAAVSNAAWVEYIPQLDSITSSRISIEDGYARPPMTPGLGIEWDWTQIETNAARRQRIS
ncbi:mandelate racemase/muconate lactonizing enzyme family protein [Herbaspirillum sp. RTI4]|uniref:mandelate racemase/muconate lactonizing enzyme family protein n=1 Tax=Herbaspirillum sp. RTI4 TaxID=3048640 RepID=UPI002AB46616|nr:mandelate racemase/muconate lactonizing enzyme family protein [Herbaspirillum sp. RTI4]MDY7578769.1 mandelate racemase/muconate lactonizing enzyme family protein [Herbaspirillum sp. RTI4]MEA9982311.1 mandelate racemase/muconate lactonizing enzyme family protein [Herbaspirillum sp. RTI4]